VLFIEVETGRSDIAANVAKYPSDAEVVMLFTSAEVAARYRDLVMLDRHGTRFLTPADVDRLAA